MSGKSFGSFGVLVEFAMRRDPLFLTIERNLHFYVSFCLIAPPI